MTHYLKILGLVLLAVFAMSAVGASAASATPQFHSEIEDTTLTGSQGQAMANILKTDLGELKCEVVKFVGTKGATTTTTITLTPKYEKCKLAGVNAFVTPNGCAYLFHLGENTETFEASMDIECPDGKQLEVEVAFCTVTIPPQTGLKEVTFTNEGETTTRSIIADLNVAGIHYKEHGFACASEEETTTNGTYTGQITVRGEDSEEKHVGLWVE